MCVCNSNYCTFWRTQTHCSRTELIEQHIDEHIDAMLQQDVTDPEADDMTWCYLSIILV